MCHLFPLIGLPAAGVCTFDYAQFLPLDYSDSSGDKHPSGDGTLSCYWRRRSNRMGVDWNIYASTYFCPSLWCVFYVLITAPEMLVLGEAEFGSERPVEHLKG